MQLMEVTLAGFHYAQGYYIERPVALQTLLDNPLRTTRAQSAA